MKAVVLKANGVLELEERDMPVLGSDEYLIRIRGAGICSSDIYRGFENGSYNYPLVMGHELSGEIAALGALVSQFQIGQKVAIFPLKPCFKCDSCKKNEYAQCASYDYYGSRSDGGFSEFLSVKEWNLLPLPNDVSLRDAALIEPMSVVVHALRRADLTKQFVQNGGRVAIIGAGFLGLLAVQILKYLHPSIEVEVCDRNLFKVNIAAQCGAVVRHLNEENEWSEYLGDIRNRYEVVIEASGAPENYVRSIQLVKHGSVVVWMGNITGDLLLKKEIVSSILRKEIRIVGTWNSSYKSPVTDDWKVALELISAGIKPASLVTNWGAMADIPALLAKMHAHKLQKTRFDHIKCVVENA